MPTVPIKPEPVEALRARYAEAVAAVVDEESIRLGLAVPPSSKRQHVFDFEDGVRLIVSQDKPGILHISASVEAGTQTFAEGCAIIERSHAHDITGAAIVAAALLTTRAISHFREISGDPRPLRFVWLTRGGILHWQGDKTDAPSNSQVGQASQGVPGPIEQGQGTGRGLQEPIPPEAKTS